MSARKSRPKCPKCRSADQVVPIAYGFAGGRHADELGKGEAVPGGCVLDEGRPKWFCRRCGHAWRRRFLDIFR